MSTSHEPLGRFRSDLVIESTTREGGANAFHIIDPLSQVSHTMTEIEYVVASCMDSASGSSNTPTASAKSTRCLRRLAVALPSSHSYSIMKCMYKRTQSQAERIAIAGKRSGAAGPGSDYDPVLERRLCMG